MPAVNTLPSDDEVRPFKHRHLHKAANFLLETYRSDPSFLGLYGFRTKADADGTRTIFDGICWHTAGIARAALGYYRAGRLVGVITCCPSMVLLSFRAVVRHPVLAVAACVRAPLLWWHFRPRLTLAAKRRWRAYTRLARAQTRRSEPRILITALAVAESARGTGVARRLLDAVAADRQWRDRVGLLEVNTWDPVKVSIYENLGFESVANGTRDGVQCWTMTRPVSRNC